MVDKARLLNLHESLHKGTNASTALSNLNMQQTEKSIVDSNLWLPKYMSGVQNLKPQDSAFILAHINDITPTDVHMHTHAHALLELWTFNLLGLFVTSCS